MSQLVALQDKLLSNVATGLFPKSSICEKVLPIITAAETTGKIGKYGNQHLRIVQSVVGGKGKYRQVDSVTRSTTGYDIEGHGLSDIVTKEDYRNVLAPFKAEEDVVMALQTILWLEKEKALADSLGSTSVLTQNTTLAGSSQWNNHVSSSPLNDIITAHAAVYDGCGEEANTAIMSKEVWDYLSYHPQFLDALGFKHNRPGGLSEAELAKVLKVEKLLIGKMKYNSAKEGQSDVLTSVWGKNFVLAVCPDKAAIGQISLGYHVQYEGEQPRKVYKQSLFNPPGATEVLVEDSYDQLLVQVAAAYLIKDAVA